MVVKQRDFHFKIISYCCMLKENSKDFSMNDHDYEFYLVTGDETARKWVNYKQAGIGLKKKCMRIQRKPASFFINGTFP